TPTLAPRSKRANRLSLAISAASQLVNLRAPPPICREAKATMVAPLADRFADQNTRLNDFLGSLYGGRIDATAAQDALTTQARAINTPAYRQAYADGANGVWTPGLENLVQSPSVQTAIR